MGKRHVILLALYYTSVMAGLMLGPPSPFVFLMSLFFELFSILTAWIIVNFLFTRKLDDLRLSQYVTLGPALIIAIIGADESYYENGALHTVTNPWITFWPQLVLSFVCCMAAYSVDAYYRYKEVPDSEFHIKNYFAVYAQVFVIGFILVALYGVEMSDYVIWLFTGLSVLRLIMDVTFRRFFHSM